MPTSTTLNTFLNLLETTEDLEVLLELQKHLGNRIEKVSESGSRKSTSDVNEVETDNDLSINLKKLSDYKDTSVELNDFIRYQEKFLPLSKTHEERLVSEIKNQLHMSSKPGQNVEYEWLSKYNVNYSFGHRTLKVKQLSEYSAISELLGLLNCRFDCSLDSFLISYHKTCNTSLSPHCDDEDIIDQSHMICNVSLGAERTINFYNLSNQDEPILSQKLSNGSLLMMLPRCQENFKHGVQSEETPSVSRDDDQFRISLSFRKVVVPNTNINATKLQLHVDGYQTQHVIEEPSHVPSSKEHLIIGDSLTRGIVFENTITVTQGGCDVPQVLEVLKNSNDILPSEYHNIKTVTVCVGTNSIAKAHIPLLQVISDYDKLIRELTALFPGALIGLFNIPPRKYSSVYHLCRIKSFNNFLYDLENFYTNTLLINLFWEYITPDGYLNLNYFNPRDHLHMNEEGKDLMRRAIFDFQNQQALYRSCN